MSRLCPLSRPLFPGVLSPIPLWNLLHKNSPPGPDNLPWSHSLISLSLKPTGKNASCACFAPGGAMRRIYSSALRHRPAERSLNNLSYFDQTMRVPRAHRRSAHCFHPATNKIPTFAEVAMGSATLPNCASGAVEALACSVRFELCHSG